MQSIRGEINLLQHILSNQSAPFVIFTQQNTFYGHLSADLSTQSNHSQIENVPTCHSWLCGRPEYWLVCPVKQLIGWGDFGWTLVKNPSVQPPDEKLSLSERCCTAASVCLQGKIRKKKKSQISECFTKISAFNNQGHSRVESWSTCRGQVLAF